MSAGEALQQAVATSDLPRIRRLVRSELANDASFDLSYLLFSAVQPERPEVIRVLAELGANLNAVKDTGMSPLKLAVTWNKPHIAELLLDLGADAEIRDERGHSPLLTAIWRQRSLKSAALLIERGADIRVRDANGVTAVGWAAYFECDEIVELMAKKHGRAVQTEANRARKNFALIAAAQANDTGAIKTALKSGADVDALSPDGSCALFYAAEHGNIQVMRFLIKSGAKVSQSGPERRDTPLLRAAYYGHREAIYLLLDSGADLLEEYIPGNFLAGGSDMDAVAFAREGSHRELAEHLAELRDKMHKERKLKGRKAVVKKAGVKDDREVKARVLRNSKKANKKRKG